MKSETTGQATIYRFENINNNFKTEPMLLVLESGLKRFSFKTDADEDIISIGSQLEPLLIS
jgi:hypothetical protein